MLNLEENSSKFINNLKIQGKSPNTLKNYRTDLDCFLLFLRDRQGHCELDAIHDPKVKEYGQYLQSRFNSDNSRRRRVQTLRLFFDYLVSANLVEDNPVRKLPTSPKVLDRPRPTPLFDLESIYCDLLQEQHTLELGQWPQTWTTPYVLPIQKILGQLICLRNRLIIHLIFEAGMKTAELAHLEYDHILKNESLNNDGPRILVVPRNRDPYSVPLSPFFLEVLKLYEDKFTETLTQQGEAFETWRIWNQGKLFFSANPFSIIKSGLSGRGLELIFESYRKRNHLHFTPKSLRQSAIFYWLQKGINHGQIKEWMGVAPDYDLAPYLECQYDFFYKDLGQLKENFTLH